MILTDNMNFLFCLIRAKAAGIRLCRDKWHLSLKMTEKILNLLNDTMLSEFLGLERVYRARN